MGKLCNAWQGYEHTPLKVSVPGVHTCTVYAAAGQHQGEPAFDGVAVLSFDDWAAYEVAVAGPEFAAAIADATNFQDVLITLPSFGDEHIIVERGVVDSAQA